MVEFFTPGMCLLLSGAGLGICIGWCLHAVFIRRYLKKHMKKHPEYKIFLETLEKKENTDSFIKEN